MRAEGRSWARRLRFSKVCRGPGPSRFGRERDPGLERAPRLALPRPVLPRRSALIPSYLGTTPHYGMPLLPLPSSLLLFLSFSLVSLSSLPVGAAAQHPLISLAGLLLENSPALILVGPPSDPLRSSSLLVPTPLERPEHSLDSILMECLRGRYLPHCRICSLVLSHSSRAPLLCWLALRWQPRPRRLW